MRLARHVWVCALLELAGCTAAVGPSLDTKLPAECPHDTTRIHCLESYTPETNPYAIWGLEGRDLHAAAMDVCRAISSEKTSELSVAGPITESTKSTLAQIMTQARVRAGANPRDNIQIQAKGCCRFSGAGGAAGCVAIPFLVDKVRSRSALLALQVEQAILLGRLTGTGTWACDAMVRGDGSIDDALEPYWSVNGLKELMQAMRGGNAPSWVWATLDRFSRQFEPLLAGFQTDNMP